MGKQDRYTELIYQLGDLARERLGNKPTAPRSMARVFKAEDGVLARREELAGLEQDMNDEEGGYQQFLAELEEERRQQQGVVRQYKKAVDTIQGRVKDLRKRITARKAELRYDQSSIKKLEERHTDLEMTTRDPARLDLSRSIIKKSRLAYMRKERELENFQVDLATALTPAPGQPGAAGILAHKRLLELEDEAEDRQLAYEERLEELDAAAAQKEAELKAAEDYLDQAVFLLGEDCYAQRISEPSLAVLYPHLDKVAG